MDAGECGALVVVLLHDAASIVSTETKGVGEGGAHGALLCFVESEVQVVVDVFIVVALLVVDGGRYDVVLDRQAASDAFYSTSSTQEVARHRLGRRNVEVVSVLAKYLCDGLGF